MQELLPNTDNFFKYILTVGVLLVIFTIMYPLQKQKEVDIEILNYRAKAEILQVQTDNLRKQVDEMKIIGSRIQFELDSLKETKKLLSGDSAELIEKIRISKKAFFDVNKQSLINTTDSLKIASINLKCEKQRIEKLGKYYSSFATYKFFFVTIGLVLVVLGLRYWIAFVYLDEVKRGNELHNGYRSSFVRHVEFCKRYINGVTITILLLLFIFVLIIMCSIG